MNNFIYENRTKVYFGKGGVKEYLGYLLRRYGSPVMLAYGGGSVRRNGVYDEVTGILQAAARCPTAARWCRHRQCWTRTSGTWR